MRKFCFLKLVLLCALSGMTPLMAAQRTLTDRSGRTITVPEHIKKVYCMSPVCQVMLYTLAPDMLAGWNYQQTPRERALIAPKYRNKPVLGGWFGKSNTGNIELIMKVHPDIMISVGPHGGTEVADRVQAQTHIPVWLGDMRLTTMPEVYIALGKLLHREKRAKRLADYSRRVLDSVAAMVAKIPPEQRRRVYYAEGPNGLATDPGNSFHSEAIVFAGGSNVAHVPNTRMYGQTAVSMEQVLNWNPDVIITGYNHKSTAGSFYKNIFSAPLWANIPAVRNHQVFESPQYPFNWVDRPPSVNRIIGIAWMAHAFYPKRYPLNVRAETRKFYRLFYHISLTDSQLDRLLSHSVRPSGVTRK